MPKTKEEEVVAVDETQSQKEQYVELNLNTINAILQYLSKQPWADSNPFIGAIHEEIRKKPPYTK